jgi:hypothetical protein
MDFREREVGESCSGTQCAETDQVSVSVFMLGHREGQLSGLLQNRSTMIRQVSSFCGTRQYQFVRDPLSTSIGFGQLLVGRQLVHVESVRKKPMRPFAHFGRDRHAQTPRPSVLSGECCFQGGRPSFGAAPSSTRGACGAGWSPVRGTPAFDWLDRITRCPRCRRCDTW